MFLFATALPPMIGQMALDFSTNGVATWLWISGGVQTLFDTVMLYVFKRFPRLDGDWGAAWDSAWGLLDIILSICYGVEGGSGASAAGDFIYSMPEVFKFARFKAIVTDTLSASLFALAALDVVCDLVAAGLVLSTVFQSAGPPSSTGTGIGAVAHRQFALSMQTP